MNKSVCSIVILIIIMSLFLVSCTQPSPSPAAAPTTAPTTVPPAKPITPAPEEASKPTPKLATPAPAGPPYFQGKTIEVIAATAPGGGTDTTARVVASFLPKHLPGNPKTLVRNVPGAGGVSAMNSFYEKAKPDGLTLIHGSATLITNQQRKRDIVKYDLLKMPLIGNIGEAGPVIGIRKDAMKRLTDPKAEPVIVGTREGSETWNVMVVYGKEFLGWNVRWLPGFGGTGEIVLAFRRGEVDMFGDAQNIKMLMQEGLAEPLAQIGGYKAGKFVPRPDFPSALPIFPELMAKAGKPLAGLPLEAYMATIAAQTVFKFTAAPPGTPDNIVKILADAYAKLEQDPQASDMLKKTFAEVYDINTGKDTEKLMKEALDVRMEAVDYVESLFKKYGVIK